MKSLSLALFLALAGTLAAQPAATLESAPAVQPLPRAHSHNDYEHDRPLLDALDHGFCSVEADIYLVEGQLLVAHDRDKVRPDRTLEALYLRPLEERARANGGRIHRGGPPVVLLIDIKSEAEASYEALKAVLAKHESLLAHYSESGCTTGAVQVILSGNRPRAALEREKERLAAMDGRMPDLEGNAPTGLIPLVSDSWQNHFTWRGTGEFPAAERAKLHALVRKAHEQGRIIRFWAAPDRPEGWRELFDAGADLINTDKLAELQKFLLSQPGSPPSAPRGFRLNQP